MLYPQKFDNNEGNAFRTRNSGKTEKFYNVYMLHTSKSSSCCNNSILQPFSAPKLKGELKNEHKIGI